MKERSADLGARLLQIWQNLYYRGFLVGNMLGFLAWGMAQQPHDLTFRMLMALIMVVCGCMSFVMHALSALPKRSGVTQRQISYAVALLGIGFIGMVQILNIT